ncbi:MAG TPA: hypothetical protein PK691_01875 [Thermomicrobiales bacterium]|nr:hypothetical protein [Thermomicrobiales bacterium]
MDKDTPAPQSAPVPNQEKESIGSGLTIDISHWGWDETRGKIIDTVTGLDLLIYGEPNPEIAKRKGIQESPSPESS